MKGSQIIDVSLSPKNKSTGHIIPIVGIEGGVMLDYDRANGLIYWVQGAKEDEDDNNSGNVSPLEPRKILITSVVSHENFEQDWARIVGNTEKFGRVVFKRFLEIFYEIL